MFDLAIRETMVATCRAMNQSGLNSGSSGNLSVRVEDGFLITPSSLPYDQMGPEDIVFMEFDGAFDGRRPSSEWRFHRDILAAREDVDVVLHCHSTYATALACHLRPIPPFHYMVAIAGGADIRCAPYATFGTQDLSDHALTALTDRKACLLGHHGQIALGRSPEAALALAIEVETLAKMYIAACTLGEPPRLSEAEIAHVRERMTRMAYGLAADAGETDNRPRPIIARNEGV